MWDPDRGVLWWVDIEGRQLHRFDPGIRRRQRGRVADDDRRGRLRSGGGLVAAPQDGIRVVDPDTWEWQAVATLGEPADVHDAKCDLAGRLLVGTVALDERPAGLFSLEPDGAVQRLRSGLGIANGLAWTVVVEGVDPFPRRVDVVEVRPSDVAIGAVSNARE